MIYQQRFGNNIWTPNWCPTQESYQTLLMI